MDLGRKPPYLTWEDDEPFPPILEIPVPFLLDPPGRSAGASSPLVAQAASELGTYAILEASEVRGENGHVIPRFAAEEEVDWDLVRRSPFVEVDDAGEGVPNPTPEDGSACPLLSLGRRFGLGHGPSRAAFWTAPR